MKKATRFLQLIYCFYAILIFALLTIFSVIAMALVLPFGREKLSPRIYKICRYWSQILYFFLGIRHEEIYEAPHHFSQAHIFVGNHNSYMDIPPIVQIVI
jgi:1-acyl-sn-glycerol-3-phosphate acyltransferase